MLYLYTPDQQDLYLQLLQQSLPDWQIAAWPEVVDETRVTHTAVWAPPPGFFARFPNLQVIHVMGAGVDALLQREDVPPQVAIFRLADAGMAQQMQEYCLYGVLHYQRQMDVYRRQQLAGQWIQQATRLARDVRVSVLGLGELGRKVAQSLAGMGYRVCGWSRQPRQIDQVQCFAGADGLRALLAQTDVLFCVLPATAETRHLLNAESLSWLPEGAAIINAGRGSLIDESALLDRLDGGKLRFAMLDVYAREPLPPKHPFWQHPRLIMTPHVAADTVPQDAVAQIAANLQAHARGETVATRVSRQQGY